MDDDKKLSLTTPVTELENKLLTEEDSDELQNIINLFNLNIKRKDIIRAAKLNELQDKAVDQIAARIEQRPDEFSNKDLLDYYKTIQDTLKQASAPAEVPHIQINQNIVNVDNRQQETLDKDSRDRVLDAVQAILGNTLNKDESTDEEVIDVEAKKVEEE